MNGRQLDPGRLPARERRGRADRSLLALSGGGYRGLFTATVLDELERDAGVRAAAMFDAMAGTSIGGILAIGMACGVSAATLAALIGEHGSAIFAPKPLALAGMASTRYGPDGLRRAIVLALTEPIARRPFAEIPFPLAIVAVDETTNRPRVFRTNAMCGGDGDRTPTIDVALATSAAPTYFPPHVAEGRTFVDGGLVANAPDLVLLNEAMGLFGCNLDDCHLLSVGTAASPRLDQVTGQPGMIGWTVRHGLIELILVAQETLAVDQVRRLRPGTFLRIDARPVRPIGLDDVGEAASNELLRLAHDEVDNVRTSSALKDWRRFTTSRRR
jgi:patatin-like phospholipase/acyl hydrolase